MGIIGYFLWIFNREIELVVLTAVKRMCPKLGHIRVELDYLCASIFSCMISMMVSFLHFGQNRGKLTRMVSLLTLILVFPLQMGQRTQKESFDVWLSIIPPSNITRPALVECMGIMINQESFRRAFGCNQLQRWQDRFGILWNHGLLPNWWVCGVN